MIYFIILKQSGNGIETPHQNGHGTSIDLLRLNCSKCIYNLCICHFLQEWYRRDSLTSNLLTSNFRIMFIVFVKYTVHILICFCIQLVSDLIVKSPEPGWGDPVRLIGLYYSIYNYYTFFYSITISINLYYILPLTDIFLF